mgnify:CR=1 FL=1
MKEKQIVKQLIIILLLLFQSNSYFDISQYMNNDPMAINAIKDVININTPQSPSILLQITLAPVITIEILIVKITNTKYLIRVLVYNI